MVAVPSQRANAVVLHGSEAIVLQQCCSNRNVWQEGRTSGGPGKFAASRERYTICTTVQAETYEGLAVTAVEDDVPGLLDSDGEEVEKEPPPAKPKIPKFAMMFKGAKDGKILKDLRALDNPDFLLIQVQEYGSYRSEDVVEALNWMLPRANKSWESMIVMLGWYSGHRTDEVRDLIKKKGHVLIYHGGGTTPFTQTNDTHLHAICQYLLVQIENQWALTQARLVDRFV